MLNMFTEGTSAVSTVSAEATNRAFGRRLRDLRRQRGLSQTELGELINLSRVTVANLESGKQNVQLHQVFLAASALDAEVGRLIPTPAELEADQPPMGRVRSDLLHPSDLLFLKLARVRLTELAGGLDEDPTRD